MPSMMGYMPRARMPMFKPFVSSPPEEIILGKRHGVPVEECSVMDPDLAGSEMVWKQLKISRSILTIV